MAFRVELGVDPVEGLSLALSARDRFTGAYIDGTLVDHQLVIYGDACEYGERTEFGQVVASNDDGRIVVPVVGTVVLTVPAHALYGGPPVWLPPPPLVPSPGGDFAPGDFTSDFSLSTLPLGVLVLSDFDLDQFDPADFSSEQGTGLGPQPPDYGAPVSPPYSPFFDCERSLNYRLLALSKDRTRVNVLAYGTISFGRTVRPRFTLDSYPAYAGLAQQAILGLANAALLAA